MPKIFEKKGENHSVRLNCRQKIQLTNRVNDAELARKRLIKNVDIEGKDLTYIGIDKTGRKEDIVYDLKYEFFYKSFWYRFKLSHNGTMSKLFVRNVGFQDPITPEELYDLRNVATAEEGLCPEELCYMTSMFKNTVVEVDTFEELWTKKIPNGRDFFVSPIFIEEDSRQSEFGKNVDENHFITVAATGNGKDRKLFIIDSNKADDDDYSNLLSGKPGENVFSLNKDNDVQGEESSACGLYVFNVCFEASKCKDFKEFKSKFPNILLDIKNRLENTERFKEIVKWKYSKQNCNRKSTGRSL